MGKAIERLAIEAGDTVTCRIDADNTADFDSEDFRNSDVAIEFSVPATGADNVLRALKAGVPVVSGTTGWQERLPEVEKECRRLGASMMWASNFSIGVNLFMDINRRLARLMNAFPAYRPHIVETHHVHKLDHPSGTAVTLAQDIIAEAPRIKEWREAATNEKTGADILPVEYIRSGEVPGIHTVSWDSPVDDITLTHSAKSRDGFAAGALMAARWLISNPGVHSFAEMLRDITEK